MRIDGSSWDDYARELGLNIARVRESKGMSQDEVAAGACLSRFTYWKLERGESNPGTPANPSLRNLLAVAQSLGVDLEDLLPGTVPDLRNR
ncbi:helix-turn-helix transcriptional regulator [Bifidobacterium sp. ESL0769]|uniref:helix-turn-helix domain-containing protein n=1 Tax=Bifidobacterium sp. ESL0769 TaxID=2983229 RepID=UPI0023F76602|nr:helix-turn-helix transcriptional regulator [Bifidobacterium sp. ESL0769]WEV67821.1 helix-turn-helix transcriptional regulator [Bifidobacterium sp. ESL0769]